MAKVKARAATYEDLLRADPNLVAEIIDGELITSPRPAFPHERAAGALYSRLRSAFDDGDSGPGGWWILHEPEIRLGANFVVPDVAGWRRETTQSFPLAGAIETAPDWVCEVLSPSNESRDRRLKMPLYARHGVEWAWIVDPIEQLIEVSRLSEGHWLNVATYGGDETVRIAPFDAMEISLSRLWITLSPPS
jgi:Uma2 family endonuclease